MLDKQMLLAERFGVESYEIPGVGEIRVRPLTRSEALQVGGKGMDAAEIERKVLSWAVVEPSLTPEEVRQWQDASPAGEIQEVFQLIVRMSGMEGSAEKEAFHQFRG